MSDKMVVVPQHMLDELEKARLFFLEQYVDGTKYSEQVKAAYVSNIMWEISHTKFEDAGFKVHG